MPRVRKGAARSQARKRILRLARGYYGVKHKHKYQAEYALIRAGVYQFRDRRRLKRDMRRLWIARITAACRMRGSRYSVFINGLKLSGILLNRKMLSQIAIEDPKTFDRLHEMAASAVKSKQPMPKAAPNWSGDGSGGAKATSTGGTKAAPRGKAGGPTNIEDIEGIGPKFAKDLRSAGVKTIAELLAAGSTPAGRATLAEKTGIKEASIYAWVKAADLLRISGVTPDWAELMVASGVDSVKELAHRAAGNLRSTLEKTNTAGPKAISPDVPSEALVSTFIEQAKGLKAMIEA